MEFAEQMTRIFGCYHCTRTLLMAGAFPALHWWPTIVAAWTLALLVVACALEISQSSNKTPVYLGMKLVTSVVLTLLGSYLILGLSTALGLFGLGFIVMSAGLASIRLFLGPAWAKRATAALHVALVLGLLVSHAYFWSLQSKEGKVRYGLQYGTGEDALKPMLRAMPLGELFQLTEDPMRPGRGVKILQEIVEERVDEVHVLEDSELEALAQGPMSDPLRARLEEFVENRKTRELRRRAVE